MVLEIKYVNANNAVIHMENLVTGILAKLAWDLGFGPNLGWELGFGTSLHDPQFSFIYSLILIWFLIQNIAR